MSLSFVSFISGLSMGCDCCRLSLDEIDCFSCEMLLSCLYIKPVSNVPAVRHWLQRCRVQIDIVAELKNTLTKKALRFITCRRCLIVGNTFPLFVTDDRLWLVFPPFCLSPSHARSAQSFASIPCWNDFFLSKERPKIFNVRYHIKYESQRMNIGKRLSTNFIDKHFFHKSK